MPERKKPIEKPLPLKQQKAAILAEIDRLLGVVTANSDKEKHYRTVAERVAEDVKETRQWERKTGRRCGDIAGRCEQVLTGLEKEIGVSEVRIPGVPMTFQILATPIALQEFRRRVEKGFPSSLPSTVPGYPLPTTPLGKWIDDPDIQYAVPYAPKPPPKLRPGFSMDGYWSDERIIFRTDRLGDKDYLGRKPKSMTEYIAAVRIVERVMPIVVVKQFGSEQPHLCLEGVDSARSFFVDPAYYDRLVVECMQAVPYRTAIDDIAFVEDGQIVGMVKSLEVPPGAAVKLNQLVAKVKARQTK